MPRELPIPMCMEMVKSILEGRKTQTRRIIQHDGLNEPNRWKVDGWVKSDPRYVSMSAPPDGVKWKRILVKPRYRVGDELWVRETFGWAQNSHGHNCLCYKADDGPQEHQMMRLWDTEQAKWVLEKTEEPAWPPDKWVSSQFMPKLCARLWFRVKAVKEPHQIQTISPEDCIAEGIEISTAHGEPAYYLYDSRLHYTPSPMESYKSLWNRLHPKPVERFENHPWVFGYEIERIER